MKLRMILVGTVLIILPFTPLCAVGGTFKGDVELSAWHVNISGDEAKFNEYRDMNSDYGIYGGGEMKYDSEDMFFQGSASDIGYDTQSYHIEGGKYGKYKAYFDFSEIPHNLTYGARTFYSGAGSNHLTLTSNPSSLSTWKTFNYYTDRQRYEAGFSLDLAKPFFFKVSVPHEEKTGNYPIGAGIGSGFLGSAFTELPMPIDYTTNSINMMAGYVKNPFFAAMSLYYSEFTNSNSALYFDRPRGGLSSSPDAYSLPPDNESYKVAFKGSVKMPMRSQFSMNVATGRTKSDDHTIEALTSNFGPTFHGKVDTTNMDLILTSHPVRLLNAKIAYKYYQRDNKSDELTLNGDTNDLLGYKKNRFGIDLGWNLPSRFHLDTAYTYLVMSRQFSELLPETRDNTLSAELRYRGLDYMTPKISYEWMQRDADHVEASATDVEYYIWRFDVAPQTRNTIKASVDIYPTDDLDFNIGYKYVDKDFRDTILGLRSIKSNRFNFDASYAFGKKARLNGYFDLDFKKDYQYQRTFSPTGSPNPATQDASNYNWDVTTKDNSYSWGLGTDIYVIPKRLTITFKYDDVKSDGTADYTYLLASALGTHTNDDLDMAQWDDYRLSSFSTNVKYTPMASRFTYTVGYVYERYKYDDARYADYMMIQGGNYLTGAYADPSYTAHVVFIGVDYRF